MNNNKGNVLKAFINNRMVRCFNDNTRQINDIICLIEFYNSNELALYYAPTNKPLHSCYVDNNGIIHISKNITKCYLYKPEKKYINEYNNSIISTGLKIRNVYFKDHVDWYKYKNSKVNIIKKFRHDNRCINDNTSNVFCILGLVEFNDPERELAILKSESELQLLPDCYLNSDGRLHEAKLGKIIYPKLNYTGRESVEDFNRFAVLHRMKIKKIHFKHRTEIYNV
jgi:hypothetical protein